MNIDNSRIHPTSIASEQASGPSAAAPKAQDNAADQATTSRNDRVVLSPAARAMTTFGPERIEAIRARIIDGTYDSAAVIGETARRIAASGDLS